jgi:glycosyltransferase involved in cell wall biosynthesis
MTDHGLQNDHRERLKVLLVGHAFSPGAGSEPGFTWNWAWHLSEHHDVWVIAHPQFRAAVEAVMSQHLHRALHVVWVDLPERLHACDPWDPARGEQGIHLHYVFWQHAAFAQARSLQARVRFDIVHHVSWGTVNDPPPLWRLGPPFVWGPLGGGQAAPLTFALYLGGRGFLREVSRTARRHLVPLRPSLRRAAAHSAAILATNRETSEVLKRAGASRVELFLDGGIQPDEFIARRRLRTVGDRLELVWAGRLEARKALSLALEAMALVPELSVRLSVAGEGPLRRALERRTVALGLGERVRFLGLVPRARLLGNVFANSDAFLFTSLQDSFGSVVIEAMAAGLPVLGLDHQGFGTMIPRQAAIKVPVTSPAATIRGLADGIRTLAASPDVGQRMGAAARCHALSESWSLRVVRMNELYRRCLDAHAADPSPRESGSGRAMVPEACA